MLVILPIVLARWTTDHVATGGLAIWIVAGLLSAIWLGFIGWRAVILIMRFNARSERLYDERDKFALPPEYRDTESAVHARARRRGRPMPSSQERDGL